MTDTDTAKRSPDGLNPPGIEGPGIVAPLRGLAVPVDTLEEWAQNPRHGDDPSVKSSLVAFGLVSPVIYKEEDGRRVVFAGNTRLRAARALGWTHIAAVNGAHLNADQVRAFALADNRTSELGTFDDTALAEILEAVAQVSDELMGATGYTPDDLTELLDSYQSPEADNRITGDPDAVPEPPPDPITKPGDRWRLGNHTLVCGDAATASNYPVDDVVALVVTDPPYGVSYADKNEFLNGYDKGNHIQQPIENDHMTPEETQALWVDVFTVCHDTLRPGGVYYVTGPQGGDLLLLLLALKESGLILKHMLIWAKNNHVLGRCDYNYKHEPILYGWKEGGHKFYGDGTDKSVWEIDKPHASKLHPTMKPVALYERAIRNSSKPGEMVLDPFAGSGTAIVAAEGTGRVCHAIELDPHYCDVICARWEAATGVTPVLDASGEPVSFAQGAVTSGPQGGPA